MFTVYWKWCCIDPHLHKQLELIEFRFRSLLRGWGWKVPQMRTSQWPNKPTNPGLSLPTKRFLGLFHMNRFIWYAFHPSYTFLQRCVLGPELKPKPVIVSTRKADSLLLFPTSEEKAQKEAEVAEASKATLRLASLETQRLRGWWEKTRVSVGSLGLQKNMLLANPRAAVQVCVPDIKKKRVFKWLGKLLGHHVRLRWQRVPLPKLWQDALLLRWHLSGTGMWSWRLSELWGPQLRTRRSPVFHDVWTGNKRWTPLHTRPLLWW